MKTQKEPVWKNPGYKTKDRILRNQHWRSTIIIYEDICTELHNWITKFTTYFTVFIHIYCFPNIQLVSIYWFIAIEINWPAFGVWATYNVRWKKNTIPLNTRFSREATIRELFLHRWRIAVNGQCHGRGQFCWRHVWRRRRRYVHMAILISWPPNLILTLLLTLLISYECAKDVPSGSRCHTHLHYTEMNAFYIAKTHSNYIQISDT